MDVALVERARKGDREAFATLARLALPWMDGVARLTLRDPDLARDAVQEALLRAWKGCRVCATRPSSRRGCGDSSSARASTSCGGRVAATPRGLAHRAAQPGDPGWNDLFGGSRRPRARVPPPRPGPAVGDRPVLLPRPSRGGDRRRAGHAPGQRQIDAVPKSRHAPGCARRRCPTGRRSRRERRVSLRHHPDLLIDLVGRRIGWIWRSRLPCGGLAVVEHTPQRRWTKWFPGALDGRPGEGAGRAQPDAAGRRCTPAGGPRRGRARRRSRSSSSGFRPPWRCPLAGVI